MSRRILTTLLAAGLAAAALAGEGGRVASTVHNLSVSGPGRIKSTTEKRICAFCHAPHTPKGAAPLWNRELPTGPFVTWRSRSKRPEPEASRAPDGASRLCLSCHDGTLALGAMANRDKPVQMQGTAGGRMPAQARGHLGRDLSGSHPISFRVTPELVARRNESGRMLAPVAQILSDPDVKLDAQGKMQCTTCHDPHDDRNFGSSGVHFYRKPEFSDVCLVCHDL